MKTLLLLHFVSCSLILVNGAQFTNSVSVDSFVRAAAPAFNYGGAGSLTVSGATATNFAGTTNGVAATFLRFNTAAMVTNLNALFGANRWYVNGATLRLIEIGAPPNPTFTRGAGGFEVRWIGNDGWAEGSGTPSAPSSSGITYKDVGSLLAPATDVVLGTFTNSGLDAVQALPLALASEFVRDVGAGSEVGLYLSATESKTGFTFNSRSFGSTSAGPYLEISAIAKPSVSIIRSVGPEVTLVAINGVVGNSYALLASTTLALPISQWASLATNQPVSGGTITFRLTNAPSGPTSRFFALQIR